MTPLYRYKCRFKHNYYTTIVTTASIQMQTQLSYTHRHDDLYADVNTTIKRPPSQRPLIRCKHNNHTPTVTTVSMQM
jgi:hypothetical protein